MKYKETSDKIINAFYRVYNKLGTGFLEKTYENALLLELKKRGFSVNNQVPINIIYKKEIVGNYISDILVNDKILLELKAIRLLSENDNIQLLNYLAATKYEVGLLFNFGNKPEISRVVYDNQFRTYNNPQKKKYQFPIRYEKNVIGNYQAPFFINNMIVVILGKKKINSNDEQQLLNYLSATGIESGLIFNFGQKSQVKRKFINPKQSV